MPSIVSFFGLSSPSKIEISDDEGSFSGTDVSEKHELKKQRTPTAVEDIPLAAESEDDEDDDEVPEDE